MAVGHDVGATESHAGTAGSTNEASFSWSHDRTGTPRGVLVFVVSLASTGKATSVTYAGTNVPEVTAAKASDTVTEPGTVQTFFLGSGVPTTDPATIVVNRTNDATEMWAVASIQTAAADLEVYELGIILLQENQTLAGQSVTDGSTGVDSWRYAACYSGGGAPPAAHVDSTQLHFIDFGQQVAKVVREDVGGQGSRIVGFEDATADDVAAVHLAVREVVATGATTVRDVGNIASAEAFGVPKSVRLLKHAGAILTAELVSTPRAVRVLKNAGAVVTAEAFGEPRARRVVKATGAIASAEAFGEPDLRRLIRAVGNIPTAESFGEPDLLRVLRPEGITSLEAFGAPRVLFVIRPEGIESEEFVSEPALPDFASAVIVIRDVGNIASAEAFGIPALVRLLRPEGVVSAEAFGDAKAVRLVRHAGGIVTAEAFGEPKALRVVRPEGVETAETFGEPKLVRLIFPVSIETAEAFGLLHAFDPAAIGPNVLGGVLLTDGHLYGVLIGNRVYW